MNTLRNHFIKSSTLGKPNYTIYYTADLHVPFIGGEQTRRLTMWETGDELEPLATFNVVSDNFSDGYGEWEIATSDSTSFYGLIKDENGLDYSMDSGNFHTITGLVFPDYNYDDNSIISIGGPLLGGGEGNSLTDVTLPYLLRYLGDSTFKGSTHLQTITIPEYVTSIGKDCFKGCTNLVDFYCNSSTPPSLNGLDIFGCYTDIPNLIIKVLYLENYLTNDDWKLYSNIIKLNPKTIGYKAPSKISLDSSRWSGFSIRSHLYNSGYGVIISNNELATSVPSGAFQYITGITDIFLPESITHINSIAFQKCSSLKNILIPKNIQVFGQACFSYTNLSEITVPKSIILFGNGLFVGTPLQRFVYEGTLEDWCKIDFTAVSSQYASYSSNPMYYGAEKVYIDGKNIEGEVTMPTVINKLCIVNNNLIHSIVIPENTSQVQTMAICNCEALTKVQWNAIECQVINYGNIGVFLNCPNITEFIFGDEVKHIPLYVCSKCSISNITIPNSVTSIGEYAFDGCSSLTSIVIPESVTSIGEYALSNCSSLTSIVIPESVTSIELFTFGSCKSLTSVTIPASVTSIGMYAFYNCSSLTSVTIPSSVTSIGDEAFGATGIYNNESNWEDNVLYIDNCLIKANTSISGSYTVKENTRLIADSAFSSCESLTSVTISEGVASIGKEAFWGSTSLASVIIPASVTSIGDYAFKGCSALRSITFNGTKAQWGEIKLGMSWNSSGPTKVIHCTDGDVTL